MHVHFDPNSEISPEIKFDDFLKVDIRVGEILDVLDFPEARNPSYKLVINFGKVIGEKKSSAQITINHSKEELIGKRVMAVVNFPKRQIGKFMSEVLVLGFADDNGDVLLNAISSSVPLGARLL